MVDTMYSGTRQVNIPIETDITYEEKALRDGRGKGRGVTVTEGPTQVPLTSETTKT